MDIRKIKKRFSALLTAAALMCTAVPIIPNHAYAATENILSTYDFENYPNDKPSNLSVVSQGDKSVSGTEELSAGNRSLYIGIDSDSSVSSGSAPYVQIGNDNAIKSVSEIETDICMSSEQAELTLRTVSGLTRSDIFTIQYINGKWCIVNYKADSDGSDLVSEIDIETGKAFRLRSRLDMVKGICSVWIDSNGIQQSVVDNVPVQRIMSNGYKSLQLRYGVNPGRVYIDNIAFSVISDFPEVLKITSVFDGTESEEIKYNCEYIRVYFDGEIDSSTVTSDNVKLYDEGKDLNCNIRYNEDKKVIEIVPSSYFGSKKEYELYISKNVKAKDGSARLTDLRKKIVTTEASADEIALKITSPKSGTYALGSITEIKYDLNNVGGNFKSAKLYIDGVMSLESKEEGIFKYDSLTAGTHIIGVTAETEDGYTAEDTVTVNVSELTENVFIEEDFENYTGGTPNGFDNADSSSYGSVASKGGKIAAKQMGGEHGNSLEIVNPGVTSNTPYLQKTLSNVSDTVLNIEFDLYLPTSSAGLNLEVKDSTTGKSLYPISAGKYPQGIKVGEWNKIKCSIDATQNTSGKSNLYSVWVNNNLELENVAGDSQVKAFNYLRFHIVSVTGEQTSVILDNIKIYLPYVTMPAPESVFGLDQAGNETSDIPFDAKKIGVKFSSGLSGENFYDKVKVSDKTGLRKIDNIEYSDEKLYITLSEELGANTDFIVTFDKSLKNMYGKEIGYNQQIMFRSGSAAFDMASHSFVRNGDCIKLSAVISNKTSETRNILLVITSWNQNDLIGCKAVSAEVKANDETEASTDYADYTTGGYAEGYVIYNNELVSQCEYGRKNQSESCESTGYTPQTLSVKEKISGQNAVVTVSKNGNPISEELINDGDAAVVAASAGADGYMSKNIGLTSLSSGKYIMKYYSAGTVGEKFEFDHMNINQAKEALKDINEFKSASDIERKIGAWIDDLGFDKDLYEKHKSYISSRVYSQMPSDGYGAKELYNTVYTAIAEEELKTGDDARAVIRKYAVVLGINYSVQAGMVTDDEWTYITEFMKRVNYTSVTVAEALGEACAIAKVVSAVREEDIKNAILDNKDELGIDINKPSSSYESCSNKSKVWRNLLELKRNKTPQSIADVQEMFYTAIKNAMNNTSGGSSSGGISSGGSSSSKSDGIIASGRLPDKIDNTEHSDEYFNDIKGHWSYDTVIKMKEKGIIAGFDDGSFKPDQSVTRAEFVTMLTRAVKLTGEYKNMFSDVPESAWYADAVSAAAQQGIINGYDGNFLPNDAIQRQDSALILYHTLVASGRNFFGRKEFSDSAEIADYAKDAVEKLYNAGTVNGNGGYFYPANKLTRAEAAVLLSNLTTDVKIEDGTKSDIPADDISGAENAAFNNSKLLLEALEISNYSGKNHDMTAGEFSMMLLNTLKQKESNPQTAAEKAKQLNILSNNVEYNSEISIENALQMVVSALGYNIKMTMGRDSSITIAADLKLTKDVSNLEYDRNLTEQIAFILINNMLNSEPMKKDFSANESYYQSAKTLLEDIWDITKIEGILTAAGEITYAGNTVAGKDSVCIDDVRYQYGRDAESLIGYKVDAYQKNDDDVLFCIVPQKKNSEITIGAYDTSRINNYKLLYYENNKQQKYTLDTVYDVFYNGVAYNGDDWLKKIGYDAKIRLLDNDNDAKYEFVFIDDPKYMIVSAIDYTSDTLYGKNAEKIDFGKCQKYSICADDGTEYELNEISGGSFIKYYQSIDGTYVRAIELDNSISGVLTSADASNAVLKTGTTEYKVSREYLRNNSLPALSAEYKYYLDNDVVVFIDDGKTNMKYAYIIKAYSEDGIDNYIRILDQSGDIITLKAEDKITLDGSRKNVEDIINNISKQLVKYKLSGKGNISVIDTAENDNSYSDVIIDGENNGLKKIDLSSEGLQFKVKFKALATSYRINNAYIFQVTDDESLPDEDRYRIIDVSAIPEDKKITGSVYNVDKNRNAEAVLTSSLGEFVPGSDTISVVVDSVYEAVNDDNEVANYLTYYSDGNFVTKELKSEVAPVKQDGKKLEMGDVIRISTDRGKIAGFAVDFNAAPDVMGSDNSSLNNYNSAILMQIFAGYIYSADNNQLVITGTEKPSRVEWKDTHLVPIPSGKIPCVIRNTDESGNIINKEIRVIDSSEILTYLNCGENADFAAIRTRYFDQKAVVIYRTES